MKTISNLSAINKILVTTYELIESDIDEYLFSDKINNDIKFFQLFITDIYFDKSLFKEFKEYTNLKNYYMSVKNYNRLLEKIIANDRIVNSFNIDLQDLLKKKSIIESILHGIKSIEKRKTPEKSINYIDEEEYNLLLENLSDELPKKK